MAASTKPRRAERREPPDGLVPRGTWRTASRERAEQADGPAAWTQLLEASALLGPRTRGRSPLGLAGLSRTDRCDLIAELEIAMTGRANLLTLGVLSVALASGCTEQPTPIPPAPVRPATIVQKQDSRPAEVKNEADWLQAARDPDPVVRRHAAMATQDVDVIAEVAVPVLIELLKDADDEVRWHTPVALTRFGAKRQPAIVPALAEALLRDRHDWVRSHAAMALSSIAFDDKDTAKPALPALTAALKDKAAQTNAAMALNNFGRDASPAAPALLEALKDKS